MVLHSQLGTESLRHPFRMSLESCVHRINTLVPVAHPCCHHMSSQYMPMLPAWEHKKAPIMESGPLLSHLAEVLPVRGHWPTEISRGILRVLLPSHTGQYCQDKRPDLRHQQDLVSKQWSTSDQWCQSGLKNTVVDQRLPYLVVAQRPGTAAGTVEGPNTNSYNSISPQNMPRLMWTARCSLELRNLSMLNLTTVQARHRKIFTDTQRSLDPQCAHPPPTKLSQKLI